MSITYGQPLERAWARMKKALFQPFSLGKWFTIGFSAWLAQLADGGTGGGPGNIRGSWGRKDLDVSGLGELPGRAWDWLMANPLWTALIVTGIVLVIAIILLLLWLSSRGRFVFLENVVRDEALITDPWRRHRRIGNSLFGWRVGFAVISLFFVLILAVLIFSTVLNMLQADNNKAEYILFLVLEGVIFLLVVLVIAFISFYLKNFVVPIMYRYECGAMEGWRLFLQHFRAHFGHFILYALFVFVLGLAVGFCVVLAGLLTCCIGLILLAVPFIGAVILLPVSYTYRALSVEYLAQFDAELDLFSRVESAV
ncbi:MAG: hypothetical protein JXQ27_01720 [Acidobacteria bacterium]|nr:hypothetical protein [Acidobacteriota bacterium]